MWRVSVREGASSGPPSGERHTGGFRSSTALRWQNGKFGQVKRNIHIARQRNVPARFTILSLRLGLASLPV
jgi:hypothetical protein